MSIQKRLGRTLAAVSVLFLLISFLVSLVCIIVLSRSYRTSLADAAGGFAAVTIDADDARNYLTVREGGEAYDAVLQKLCAYQENNETVERISFVSFSNTAGNYIYDTAGSKLGDRLEYDSYTDSVQEALLDGHESWSRYVGGSIILYRPLRTIDDKLAGYLIVEVRDTFRLPCILLIAAACLVLLGVGIALTLFMMRHMGLRVFQPIQRFTDAALSFTGGSSTETDLTELFSNRNDEIGRLGSAIQKMFVDISSGAESLNQAIYEANHDGMTEVLNKGCYMTMEEKFRNCSSICVIYFDVNNLKLMNDTLGHERGDFVIKQAADYIRTFLTPADYCFRMGGDEFLMVMTECSFRVIDALVERLDGDSPYILNPGEESVHCALSYGYAYAKGEYSYEALLVEAEENMYIKKTELKKLMQMPDR